MTAATADDESGGLVGLYRQYFGEPDSTTDVYLGFVLFFAGLGIGLLALVLFAVERGVLEGYVWWVREIAFAGGAVGLPLVLLAVVVLLPSDSRATIAAAAGFAVTVGAVVFFVSVYPSNWNYGADYSLRGVTVYAVGLVSVLAATGSALVGYHVERARGGPAVEQPAQADDGPEVTDEKVRRDIDEAMDATEISWGGVERVETQRLHINEDADLDGQNLDRSIATVHRSSGIDEQLSALKGMKGGEERTASGSGVDGQTAALRELREQKRREAEAESRGLLHRLKALLGLTR